MSENRFAQWWGRPKYLWFWVDDTACIFPRHNDWCRTGASWNISRKYCGSVPCLNLYHNFTIFRVNLSFIFSKYSCLNSGSVWVLHLMRLIIRIARFLSLIKQVISSPQVWIEYCICRNICALFIVRRIFKGRNGLRRFITPKVRQILLEIFWVWACQFICSSITSPRKLKLETILIWRCYLWY